MVIVELVLRCNRMILGSWVLPFTVGRLAPGWVGVPSGLWPVEPPGLCCPQWTVLADLRWGVGVVEQQLPLALPRLADRALTMAKPDKHAVALVRVLVAHVHPGKRAGRPISTVLSGDASRKLSETRLCLFLDFAAIQCTGRWYTDCFRTKLAEAWNGLVRGESCRARCIDHRYR